MRQLLVLPLLAICGLALAAPRWSHDKPEPTRARVTIYRIAPGRHVDFLKWMAVQDDVAREAGIATVQLYTHVNGADWDFIGIAPVTTPEQDRKADEIAAKRGLKTGFPALLEFRELVTSHTDTFAEGPISAAALLALASK
jgi:hypothetical protein